MPCIKPFRALSHLYPVGRAMTRKPGHATGRAAPPGQRQTDSQPRTHSTLAYSSTTLLTAAASQHSWWSTFTHEGLPLLIPPIVPTVLVDPRPQQAHALCVLQLRFESEAQPES